MGFMIKSACEYECEYLCDEEFTTLRKAINEVKSWSSANCFFTKNDGNFYIINTETGDRIHYNYGRDEKVKRIKLYKNEKPKYKVIKCGCRSIFDDKYYSTLRRSFEAMKELGTGWYILVDLKTNEKKLYFSNGHKVHIERDPYYINLYSKDLG